MKRAAFLFVTLFTLSVLTPPRVGAAENPALEILKISAGVLAGIEAVHLLYLLARKISRDAKENRISILSMKTNFPPPMTEPPVPVPAELFASPVFATNRFVIEEPVLIAVETNEPVPAGPDLSHLTPAEKSQLELFGWDYYYLVGIQYDKVGKPDQGREHLFHSIAIGMMVEESKEYLRQRFKLSDAAIARGVRRYARPPRQEKTDP